MDIKYQIFINQLSQGIHSVEEGIGWFEELTNQEQFEVIETLIFFLLQAGAVGSDVETAISESGMKSTFTPCQLLLKAHREEPRGNHLMKQILIYKVLGLPANERLKTFRLLVHLFRVADIRKRAKGLEPMRLWWHRDLSKQEEIDQIISQYKAGNLMTDND